METIENIIEYFALFMSALMLVLVTNKQLQIFQQSHYQFRSFPKNLKLYYLKDASNFWPPFIFFYFYLHFWYIQLAFGIYLGILIFIKLRRKSILKLNFTARIKRLYFILIVLDTLLVSFLAMWIQLPHLASGVVILLLAAPFTVYLGALLIQPLELLISRYYLGRAKRKLKYYAPVIIGITGSYGKTGTKNILFSFLKDKFTVLPSPASYNTLNGLAITVNRLLEPEHEMVIAEMGASQKKDIEKLVKLMRPKHGIVTTIGPQHLETFKSIDNIVREKMKLIEALPKDGIAVVNYDNEYIKNYAFSSKRTLIKIGINEGADYRATDIKADMYGISFKIKYKNKEVALQTPLLGKHNLYNILAAFAMGTELGVPEKDMVYQASVLEPVENRLKLRSEGELLILDDAFNSNPEGFVNALEVLSYFNKFKILITPGIVEGGKEEFTINYSLAKPISEVSDLVILVKTKASMAIKQGLDDCEYREVEFVDDFRKAMKIVREKYSDAVVLIENDITDIYKI